MAEIFEEEKICEIEAKKDEQKAAEEGDNDEDDEYIQGRCLLGSQAVDTDTDN